jgi:hypothetical protein
MASLKHSFEYLYKKVVRYAYILASEGSTPKVNELIKTYRFVWQVEKVPELYNPIDILKLMFSMLPCLWTFIK